jgi:hypothetical protein
MIVIDINTLHSVFEKNSSDHLEYRIVYDWIIKQKGAAFVYGGTKYKKELQGCGKYLKMISLLNDQRKVKEINHQLVDNYEKYLETICSISRFDDKHIVAILAISKCRLVCSKDSNSYGYIKNKDYYPADNVKPKIYSGSRTRKLLNKKNIINLQNVIN